MSRTPSGALDNAIESLFVAKQRANDERAKRRIEHAVEFISEHTAVEPPPAQPQTPKRVGDRISEFELPGVDDDGIGMFHLSEYTETGPVVLAFYPFDFSPTCTNQRCTFRDLDWLTLEDDVDVLGISGDSVYAHGAYRAEHGLKFPLLTDRLAAVADQFGVKYDTWEDHPAVCQRALFALDDTRTIRYRWVTEDATEEPSIDDIEDAIAWAE